MKVERIGDSHTKACPGCKARIAYLEQSLEEQVKAHRDLLSEYRESLLRCDIGKKAYSQGLSDGFDQGFERAVITGACRDEG